MAISAIWTTSSTSRRTARVASRTVALPRLLWLGCLLALAAWQAFAGLPGVSLLVLAAGAPLLALPRRSGPGWLAAGLAPALGLAGLAGAFPALAGQRSSWLARAGAGRARLLVAGARGVAAEAQAVARPAIRTAAEGGMGELDQRCRHARDRTDVHSRATAWRGGVGACKCDPAVARARPQRRPGRWCGGRLDDRLACRGAACSNGRCSRTQANQVRAARCLERCSAVRWRSARARCAGPCKGTDKRLAHTPIARGP